MRSLHYTIGADTALEDFHLEKVAIVAPLTSALTSAARGLWSAGGSLASKGLAGAKNIGGQGMNLYSANVTKPLEAYGASAEKWVGNQAGKVLGREGTRNVQRLVKGVPSSVLTNAAGGAALGAGFGGITGALGAEEGNRLSGALEGAGRGAGSFALMGGAGGLASGLTRNVGRMGVNAIAKNQGLRRGGKEVNQVMQPGFGSWKQNVKQVFTGEGPLGRGGAAAAAATGTAGLAADYYGATAAEKLMGGGQPQQPQQPAQPGMRTVTASALTEPPAQDQSVLNKSLVLPAITGPAAGIGTAAAIRAMQAKKILPIPAGFGAQIAPMVASSAGSIYGHSLGKKLNKQDSQEESLKKLEAVDLDKLLRYYKKKPE